MTLLLARYCLKSSGKSHINQIPLWAGKCLSRLVHLSAQRFIGPRPHFEGRMNQNSRKPLKIFFHTNCGFARGFYSGITRQLGRKWHGIFRVIIKLFTTHSFFSSPRFACGSSPKKRGTPFMCARYMNGERNAADFCDGGESCNLHGKKW